MRAKRGKHAARARVHQGDAHHRVHAAQRSVFHQHRKALLLQRLNARLNARVFGKHFWRYIRQGDFTFQNFAFDGPLKNFGQTLHLRLCQRIAGTHAIAHKQVFDQVGREIHHRAVRLPHIGQRTNAARYIAGVGVDQMRATQFALGVVNFPAVCIQNFRRQRIFAARLEPALVGVVHERRVGDVFAPERTGVEMVVVEALDIFAQGRRQRAFFGRALAIGKTHGRVRVADMQ